MILRSPTEHENRRVFIAEPQSPTSPSFPHAFSGNPGGIRTCLRATHRLSMTFVKSPFLFFSRPLANCLSGDVRQMVIFVVRLMISPHDKNNLQPTFDSDFQRSTGSSDKRIFKQKLKSDLCGLRVLRVLRGETKSPAY
jgi:hypothetical protein